MKAILKLFISDVHCGKAKNEDVANNLISFLKEMEDMNKLDYLIISGDFFDGRLSLGSESAVDAYRAIFAMANLCILNNVKLRWLEGTPRHDRGQIKLFNSIHPDVFSKLDFKYINTTSIVEEEEGHILYVPDLPSKSTQLTFTEIKELLKEKSIDKVFGAVVHGGFDFNLKIVGEDGYHRTEDFLSITEHFTVSGHVHKPAKVDRILIPGSFDRLKFGEEEPKGALLTVEHLDDSSKDEMYFLENKRSKLFVTFKINSTNINGLIDELMSQISKYDSIHPKKISDDSSIRLILLNDASILNTSNLAFEINNALNSRFDITIKTEDGLHQEEEEVIDVGIRKTQQINHTNIKETLSAHLLEKNVSPEIVESVLSLIKGTDTH